MPKRLLSLLFLAAACGSPRAADAPIEIAPAPTASSSSPAPAPAEPAASGSSASSPSPAPTSSTPAAPEPLPPLPSCATPVAAGAGHDLSTTAVQRRLVAFTPKVKACYQAALRSDPSLEGKVVLTLAIDASGCVTSVVAKRDGLNAAVASCAASVMRSFQIEPPGSPTTINVPFAFKRPDPAP